MPPKQYQKKERRQVSFNPNDEVELDLLKFVDSPGVNFSGLCKQLLRWYKYGEPLPFPPPWQTKGELPHAVTVETPPKKAKPKPKPSKQDTPPPKPPEPKSQPEPVIEPPIETKPEPIKQESPKIDDGTPFSW